MERLEQSVLPGKKTDAVFVGDSPLPAATGKAESTSVVIQGETFVGIRNVDAMPPFLMSIVSNGSLWLFVGSNSPFTAGRGDADHAIFPYRTADKILGQPGGSGVRTIFLVERDNGYSLWEPWQSAPSPCRIERNLFKSALGTSVIFEEINHDLGLRFAWRLTSSERFGLVRFCTLENLGADTARVRCLDGWNQIIPPGVTQELYEKYSYLAAAYMRHEQQNGLGIFTLNSGITDRAEPCESLRVAVAWALGLSNSAVLLSARRVENFRYGQHPKNETEVRGEFGAFLAADSVALPSGESREWLTVADTGLDHCAVVELQKQLALPAALKKAVEADVLATRDGLKRRIAAADGLQQTADTTASVHHFANVLFNCMRGGTLPDSYHFPKTDLIGFLRVRNVTISGRYAAWLVQLPDRLDLATLRHRAANTGDAQLIRLAREYLPLTFSRRHGDPSRPWNRFAIRTRDEHGQVIFDYQGNWRDIFQNWESLAQSYPVCLESMVAIFLNASTADGYNPYRITRAGIDWEVEDPHDPWSHIGYWGDHQIIYLLRLLESLEQFEPGKISRGLNDRIYACADVPYEIKDFNGLIRDPRHSIHFNLERHKKLLARAGQTGNDGKLLSDATGEVRLFSLAEKLLVPLLAKLSNLVPGGGIWLNTQRPEWNDANNALAGWGLSMVTVGHLRRYLQFLSQVFAVADESIELSTATAHFAAQITTALSKALAADDDAGRFEILAALGRAGEQYRQSVYLGELDARTQVPVAEVRHLLATALEAVDTTLRANRRTDGMFHSYNLLKFSEGKAAVVHLNLMLEGQVSVLGSGLLGPVEALALLQSLRHSELFRADQHSYLLYPDREVAGFLSRNTLPAGWEKKISALATLVQGGWREIISVDENGSAHFQADLTNAGALEAQLDRLANDARWKPAITQDRAALLELWETVFHHRAFTGRSGSMFAFEGLGSIYWHMIAKLLVAAEESHQHAVEHDLPDVTGRLRAAYYDIRRGLGFTKSPEAYGAFPTDPYSHTPRHLGAQQPGMTGQVKEEILTRRAELGVRVVQGALCFGPKLLRCSEFFTAPHEFVYVDLDDGEQTWKLPAESLAFTCCQVPVCYQIANAPMISIRRRDGTTTTVAGGWLSADDSREIFGRTGQIKRLIVSISRAQLCD
jgi:hypothetical protein